MIISDEVKRILQNNDFSRTNNSSLSTNKQLNSKELSRNQSPIKRKVLKIKNNLISRDDHNDVKWSYFPQENLLQLSLNNSIIEDKKMNTIQFPLINASDQQFIDNNSKTLYQTLIEIFPQEHEIWKELVEQNQTIEEVVNNNAEYFQGLLKVCQCKLELAQQDLQNKNINFNEIKYYQPKKQTTQYSRDYSGSKHIPDQPLLNQSKAYEQYYAPNLAYLQKKSVYNQQFVPQNCEKVDNFKPEYNPNLNQSTFLSTYNSNFMNWKGQYPGKITQQLSPKQQSTLPFIAETNYSKNFKQIKTDKVELQKHIKLGPFCENAQSLIKETTSQHFFQSHYSVPSKLIRPVSPRLFSTKQSFEGQYRSSFNKSYVSKNLNTESQQSSFAEKFYDSNAVKGLIDKKIKTRIF
ncbi:unnamed protein product [Paramecium pentaurelia]|uniref:Uncharacterized protein n=1 Tax=Paramecium pentaurelia TaxID=43138 RepID=A0A8S1TEG2_9CILI|nr:unnamed protein product [Paramecium pentaurelia]